MVTVGEGGGMFVVERDSGKFLWAHPFPYDNPDINMNEINLETGQTHVNVDKLFKKDGDKILGCFHNTRGLWSIAYHPKKNALYVPFQDQCLSMTANDKTKLGWGPRVGVMRPGIDPNKFMNLARIDLATGEMKVLYSQPQPSQAPRWSPTATSCSGATPTAASAPSTPIAARCCGRRSWAAS